MVTEKRSSTWSEAAKLVRKELKEAFKNTFPDTKFSVRTKAFSMGTSMDIDWTDGPRTTAVQEIVGKYQYGHFDGMTDCYESSNRQDFPQVKYVMTQRSMSDETRDRLKKYIATKFGIDMDNEKAVFEEFRAYPRDIIYREFNTGYYSE